MRWKIFFCVVFVFVVTMGTMMGIRYGEEKWSIESASKSIAAFVQKRDEEKRKAILDYFTIMIIEKEDQIDALLKEMKPPTTALDAALLMKENAWIDLIQNKEVSIVARPTYLEPFLEVDGVIIRVNRQGEWEAYKGVKEGNETFVYKLDHPIQDVKGWVKARMKKDPELLLKGANQCRSYICEQITAEREIVRDGWNSRFEQNAYIIQLVEKKPKALGVCRLHDGVGRGVMVSDVMYTKPLSTKYPFIALLDRGGVFYANTQRGVTAGVGLNHELQELALMTPGEIVFIAATGDAIVFHRDGTVSLGDPIPFQPYEKVPMGSVQNIGGKEYLFIRLASDGHLFAVEMRHDVFSMLSMLQEKTTALLHRLVIENIVLVGVMLLIGLILLNSVVKKGVAPLTALAQAMVFVVKGQWSEIHLEKRWKRRRDEVGQICRAFETMVHDLEEGVKVRDLLHKVVAQPIAEKILKEGVKLGGERREVTILFADIRHFTHMVEGMQPEEVLEMLNSCFTVLARVVDEHGGIIDKFVGDEVMVLFGAPLENHKAPTSAVACAKQMIDVMREWNAVRQERGFKPVNIGISIHTGPVIAGNMGAENHLNYTVLGHTANLAARIVDHTGEMEILITKEVKESVKDIAVEELDPVKFRGITDPVPIYRLK